MPHASGLSTIKVSEFKMLKFAEKHIARGIGRLSSDLVVERAKGCYVYGTDKRRYLDFTSGIGVVNTGKLLFPKSALTMLISYKKDIVMTKVLRLKSIIRS